MVLADWSIRRYASTLPEVHGILAVEQETFRECPYTAEELLARLARPEQRVWLAEAGGQVVGFVAGFQTCSLRGAHLEADLLAVRPGWQGQGIGAALLLALRRDAGGAQALRGIVNHHNPASNHAFARAGFSPAQDLYELMLYRIRGWVPRPLPAWGGRIRPIETPEEAVQVATLAPSPWPSPQAIEAIYRAPGVTLLAAEVARKIAGMVELVQVHTFIYSGLWLESLHTAPGRERLRAVLTAAAVEAAKERSLDVVGCLVRQGDTPLRATLLAEGFVPLDSYHIWFATPLAQTTTGP
jgi:ribosomal protein S18 acetylase RimI-like enzyme